MPSKIQVGQGAPIYSEREYTAYCVEAKPGWVDPAVFYEGYVEYRERKTFNLTLFVDAATGIVVTDINKYEQSLKEEA